MIASEMEAADVQNTSIICDSSGVQNSFSGQNEELGPKKDENSGASEVAEESPQQVEVATIEAGNGEHNAPADECPISYMNGVWQHIVMFLLVTLTSGALFSWLVVEYHFAAADMVGKKYNGYGFLTCVFVFIVSGILLHIKLLGVILNRISFMSSIYIAVALFIVGLMCIPIGGMLVPEFLFVAEILISYAGCEIYVSQYCLYGCFKGHAAIIACAFATSTLLFQVVDIQYPFYASFIIWIALLIIVVLLYRPKMPKQVLAYEGTCHNLLKTFRYKSLYPVYLNVLFGMASKIYYENGFFTRLQTFNIDSTNINYVYTASNFSAILSGLFNLLPLTWAHIVNMLMSIVFNILILSNNGLVVSCINLFLMNISSTGYITASLSLCYEDSKLFESNTLVYIAMCVGDIIGIVADKLKQDIIIADYIVIIPCLLIQTMCTVSLFFIWRNKLSCRKRSEGE